MAQEKTSPCLIKTRHSNINPYHLMRVFLSLSIDISYRIGYKIPEQSSVKLTVFDIRGQELTTLQDDAKPVAITKYNGTVWTDQAIQ